jgi:hypothetical protein
VRALLAETQEIDVTSFEERPTFELLGVLRPRVIAILDQAVETVDAIRATYHDFERIGSALRGEPGGSFFLDVDAIVESDDDVHRRIAAIGFVAGVELRQAREAVSNLGDDRQPWEIVASCSAALDRIAKAFGAIERLLVSEVEGLADRAFRTELSSSLEVRRHYAAIRTSILRLDPTEAPLGVQLTALEAELADLVAHPVYRELRFPDRIRLRSFQHRVHDWLRGGVLADEGEGLRLVEDLVRFASALGNVSRREELMAHDAELLARAVRELDGVGPRVRDALFEQLRSLVGLDREIDALIARNERSAAEWRSTLGRVQTEIAMLASWMDRRGDGHGTERRS